MGLGLCPLSPRSSGRSTAAATRSPGLTCHWQVSGRSRLSYNQMVALDLAYIDESSIWTDLRLLMRTVPVVLTGTGAY